MFGLGLWEIGVVVMIAVMLFPPREIPTIARTIARAYGSLRRTADDFRRQIMLDEELREPFDEVRSAYREARWQIGEVKRAAHTELHNARLDARVAASSVTRAVEGLDGEAEAADAAGAAGPRDEAGEADALSEFPALAVGAPDAGEADDAEPEEPEEPEDPEGSEDDGSGGPRRVAAHLLPEDDALVVPVPAPPSAAS